MNQIKPFKNRSIELNKDVKIYRNLNKKGVVFSIQQNNQVVGHATTLHLKDCKFTVNAKARDKIRLTGRKQVHAFIVGQINVKQDYHLSHSRISYNPKRDDHFKVDIFVINKAERVCCKEDGVWLGCAPFVLG